METHWFEKFNCKRWIDVEVGLVIKSSDIKIVVTDWYCCMLSSRVKFPHYNWHAALQLRVLLIKCKHCELYSQHHSYWTINLVQIECRKMNTLLFVIVLFALIHGNWARSEYFAIRRNRCTVVLNKHEYFFEFQLKNSSFIQLFCVYFFQHTFLDYPNHCYDETTNKAYRFGVYRPNDACTEIECFDNYTMEIRT